MAIVKKQAQSRRSFLKKLGLAVAGIAAGGTTVNLAVERHLVEVTNPRVRIPGLPAALEGLRICQITDVHHGPFLDIDRIHRLVTLAQEQSPDLFVLTGDLSDQGGRYVPPVWDAMALLEAPLGVWSVMGNRDWRHGIEASREGARRAGIEMIDNRSAPLERDGERIWLAGVGDLWGDEQDLSAALESVPADEPAILLTHNPDFADEMHDPRVKLMVAGHSHGGQINLPLFGPPALPCRRKYAEGLVQTRISQVYVSRGIGMATVPVRFNCRPELPVFELTRA